MSGMPNRPPGRLDTIVISAITVDNVIVISETVTVNTVRIVYYYIAQISDLSQIGLKDLVIPKRQLQTEEVDWAGFLDYDEAMKRVMKSQQVVINNLVGKGLLEKKENILKFKDFGL